MCLARRSHNMSAAALAVVAGGGGVQGNTNGMGFGIAESLR